MDDDAGYPDDAEILKKLAENLDDYFHLLVGKYWGVISAKARSILSNPQDAEEIRQDTFVQAYHALPKMIRSGQDIHFRSWLLTIAKNSCLNRKRHDQHHLPSISLNTDEGSSLVDGTTEEGPTAEDEVVQQEKNEELYKQIRQLSEYEREIVAFYIGGLSDPEIAAILGKKPGAIKKARQRAFKKLRGTISKDEY